jgi:hypothetical protein
MDLWLTQLVLTHHHLHRLQLLPSASLPGARVSSSFLSVVFFSGGLPFVLDSVRLRAVVQPFIQPTGLLSGCLDCCLIGLVVRHSPFNTSFEALGLCWATALLDQPPPPDRLENHLICVDSTKMIPFGLMQDVPWVYSRNLQSPGYSRDTIIAIMELDWYSTGTLGMRKQSYWGVLWFFKRPLVSLLEKHRNRHHDVWFLIINF